MSDGRKQIAEDLNRNPALRTDLGKLRGSIPTDADKIELPRRFQATPSQGKPGFTITDKTTGRSVVIQLHALSAVKHTLAALFPDEES